MPKEKISHKELIAPKSMQDMKAWQLSRKQFIGSMVTAGIAVQLPFNKAFGNSLQPENFLSEEQKNILQSVQEILFPSDDNGPGAAEINAYNYVVWVMSDLLKDPAEVTYFKNGIGWIDESANEIFSKKYIELNEEEKQELIRLISKENWGEGWLSVLLTFIFEALLSDPQYGGNPDSIGWQWLDYKNGLPRPTPELLYPEIFKTIKF
jgi:gluconate 2-dehydrogenase gamma chain